MNVTLVVSTKHLDVFVQTMYINEKKGSLATPTDDQASVNTPEASSGTASNSIIAQQTNGSNPSGEKNSTQHNAARSVDSVGNELSEAQQVTIRGRFLD